MSTRDSSSATRSIQATTDDSGRDLVIAPRDYFLGPVFAATKQTGPREIVIADRRYLVGGFHPMRRNFAPPALDVRHARAIFCLLSFRDPFDANRLIRFSFNEFCRRYARSNGGRYARAIAEIMADLLDAYIRVTDLKTGIAHEYRLIERVDVEKRPIRRKDSTLAKTPQLEMWFNGCTLSPEFHQMLTRIVELQHLKLSVFTAIRSPLAQAIYLYIPSRAHHHTQANPFEITLTKLLEQVSFPIPFHKSKRRELFCQHENEGRSIIQQLNGLETLSGRFRVQLTETNDQTDWKIQTWVEKELPAAPRTTGDSKILQAFLASGRSRQQFNHALDRTQPLSDYERELLDAGGITISGNERFFAIAKAVLPPSTFVTHLAEAKADALEGRAAKKSPTARLIYRLMQAVSAPTPPHSR